MVVRGHLQRARGRGNRGGACAPHGGRHDRAGGAEGGNAAGGGARPRRGQAPRARRGELREGNHADSEGRGPARGDDVAQGDRKSTRLNSSHGYISYAVFCLKKKKNKDLKATVGVRYN